MIVDVEATTAIRQAEVTAQRRMIDGTQERFGLWPERLVGDTGYGDAKNLSWLVEERGIEPHIPVVDHSVRRDNSFERSAFTFDHEEDSFICPAGKRLRQRQKVYREERPFVDENGMLRYRASKLDCSACALKPRCCPTQPARKVLRSVHEAARDLARDIATTDAYLVSHRQRKKVEILLAHLERILRMDRLRLRGPNGARDEFGFGPEGVRAERNALDPALAACAHYLGVEPQAIETVAIEYQEFKDARHARSVTAARARTIEIARAWAQKMTLKP